MLMAFTTTKTDWKKTDRMTHTEWDRIVENLMAITGLDLTTGWTQNDVLDQNSWVGVVVAAREARSLAAEAAADDGIISEALEELDEKMTEITDAISAGDLTISYDMINVIELICVFCESTGCV